MDGTKRSAPTHGPGPRARRLAALGRACVLVVSVAAIATPAAAARVKVALAARAATDGARVSLGAVAVIDAPDPALAAKLDAVIVGFAPSPGETRILERQEIVEALALAGYPPWDIDFDGASRVELTRTSQLVSTQKLKRALESAFSEALRIDSSEIALRDLELAEAPRVGGGPMELRVEFLSEPQWETPLRSRILVSVSGIPATEVDASFTAARRSSESARGETRSRRTRPRVRKERLVRSGQQVMIELEGRGLRITATGRARSSGALGDEIPVENSASGVVVIGVVKSEGRVSVRWGGADLVTETRNR